MTFSRRSLLVGCALGLWAVQCVAPRRLAGAEAPAPTRVTYGVASWPAQRGNHRAVLHVTAPAEAVRARIAWRRHDFTPGRRAMALLNAAGQPVENLAVLRYDEGEVELVFGPVKEAGDYGLYFAPLKTPDSGYFPNPEYETAPPQASPAWLAARGLEPGRPVPPSVALPNAQVVRFEAIDEFDRPDPMEVIATADEVRLLGERHSQAPYLVFPEDRRHPIRMTDRLPQRWLERGPAATWVDEAARGEFYAFQLGVYALRQKLQGFQVRFQDLRGLDDPGASIPARAWRCFNQDGVDWLGQAFTKSLGVELGRVQPLWLGVQVPTNATPGAYEGVVEVTAADVPPTRVTVRLRVGTDLLADAGDSEPWRHSRLRWLDSTLGLDGETVAPFTALWRETNRLHLLGREIDLQPNGLPARIRSLFNGSVTATDGPGLELLAAPAALVAEATNGQPTRFEAGGYRITRQAPGTMNWESSGQAGALAVRCQATLESDGYLQYRCAVTAAEATTVRDIRLELPLRREAATYLMGMNHPGGLRPDRLAWRWDREKHQDSVWIGAVHGGLRLRLRGENYERPLVNIYYHHKRLNLPPAWNNDGQGGCRIEPDGSDRVTVVAYSGPRALTPGQTLHFDFELWVTPFKPLNLAAHSTQRYFHAGLPDPQEVKAKGANVINVHHATPVNPFINYPFLRVPALKAYVDKVHDAGLKVKLYYTVRELTTHLPELWALRSLGDEILARADGAKGATWLQEHLRRDYIPAWFDSSVHDPAILTAGMSRWHNFYVEGLHWLLTHVKIDGLYIDDASYDRTVMRRVRKVLDRDRPGSLIDLHSWNHFNAQAGFACCLDLYLENLPYLDRLWIGEGRDYNTPPDYWLTEISGIPFGVPSEMLEGGGNPWRGMVYGMTARLGWSGDPRALWQAWDEFGLREARLFGYWDPACPVKTGHPEILATAYVRPGQRTWVALASWAKAPASVKLECDLAQLGLPQTGTVLRARKIAGFQEEARFAPGDAIPVAPGRGWLLTLEAETP